ncbi:MAG: siroheme synthase [Alphaproteobacteria bacterium]|nr:siroheme synthase [Alphaproteobacteria bacterium]
MNSLPLFHRIAGTKVVLVGNGAMAEAKQRLVERAGGEICSEAEAHHARLAFVALEDGRKSEAAALRLKRLGLLVNVADRPELCDFTLPSVLEREPVLIAVGTGGASAGLSKHLRLRLERLLPAGLGALASGLSEARDRIRARWPDGDDRRRAIDAALSEHGPLDPLAGGSAERVESWLADAAEPQGAQTVEITLASDDPDDLTLKQARLLGMADTVLHDPGIAEAILIRARADARRVALPGDPPADGLTVVLRRAKA